MEGVLTLILVEVESRLVRSASMLAQSALESTTIVINLPMWNPALINSRSLARVSDTSRGH
jgi:hypothetical protein